MKNYLHKFTILSILLALCLWTPDLSAQNIRSFDQSSAAKKVEMLQNTESQFKSVVTDFVHKTDPMIRYVIWTANKAQKGIAGYSPQWKELPVAVNDVNSLDPMVDIILRVDDGNSTASLAAMGFVEVFNRNGIVAGRAPASQLQDISMDRSVRYVEAAMKRKHLNDNALEDTKVTLVHSGSGLSQQYRGDGVVVGVLDTGIDFSHPDFSNGAGNSRIQYLMDMRTDGSNGIWSKAQMDSNPGDVTQLDGNGGGGHGSHVAGTAVGGGKVNPAYIGVAPNADIISVKGIRDDISDGGFSDVDVIFGVDWIFQKAAEMGKPAVANLSLGGNWGPLDGSSAYEMALSDLTGPGRIIVAAAGNEGSDYIHAGANLAPNKLYETLLDPVDPSQNWIQLWYDEGAVDWVRFAYYSITNDGDLEFEGLTKPVNAGQIAGATDENYDPIAVEFGYETIGYYFVDGTTTEDPGNGDGRFEMAIMDNDTGVDLSEYVWSVIIRSSSTGGRADLWIEGGQFYGWEIGFDDVTEMPGNTDQTVGAPSTAKKVLSVGSYVTRTRWTDMNGDTWISQVPNPSGEGDDVETTFGARSDFSSKGPTRDGRMSPDIMAPGQMITSVLSSHLTIHPSDSEEEGGVMEHYVAQGGQYMLSQGTSMASPHLAGVVALMLQANPTLDYDAVLEILTETARMDSFTGNQPNNSTGYGKVDALAAVQAAADAEQPVQTVETKVFRTYDAGALKRLFTLNDDGTPGNGFVTGTNTYDDQGKASLITISGSVISYDAIRFWVSHRKEGASGDLTLKLYNGTTASGPQGTAFYTATIPYSEIPQTAYNGEPTLVTHTLPDGFTPPSNSFFIAFEFGAYPDADKDKFGLTSTPTLGAAVPEVWELSGGNWSQMDKAWNDLNNNGVKLFLEVVAKVSVPVSIDRFAEGELPETMRLYSNYPNPFNPTTVIPFSLPENGHVNLSVYDITGRLVSTLANETYMRGHHQVQFNAAQLSSGVYYYILRSADQQMTGKMLLIK
jgi:subtilisin family serine protease